MQELERIAFDIKQPSGRRFQVVAFGLNAVDTVCVLPSYPEHGGKLRIEERHQLGGGQIATAAAVCARFGLTTKYVGRVGDDDTGQFSIQDLQKEEMDISDVDVVPGAFSQFAVILVDRLTGERTVLWDRDPNLQYNSDELKQESIVQGQVLHLDGHDVPASIKAARWAKEAGMTTCLDIDKVQPGVEELLSYIDFAIPNIDFVKELDSEQNWERGMYALGKIVPGYVIVTRGKLGAAMLWEGQIVAVPGFPVQAVDTTGAGDVFHGAFIYALFNRMPALDCVRFSNAAAMLSCMRLGARRGIPTLDEVDEVLEREGFAHLSQRRRLQLLQGGRRQGQAE